MQKSSSCGSAGQSVIGQLNAGPGERVRYENFVKQNLIAILIWAVVAGVAFAFAWRKGYIMRARNYWNATVEELRKCAWPTWDELKGSTVVVTITIALMGAFCYGVDTLFYYLVRLISVS